MSELKPITHNQIPDFIIRQKNWTEDELRAKGYEYFDRVKEVTMARLLPPEEAPKSIETSWGDTLVAEAGYVICYRPGILVHKRLDDYENWPVEPEIFRKSYKRWDVEDWIPSRAERHLIELGCRPFYKATGVWAKKLEQDVYLQSMEHEEPVRIKTGQYVAIGVEGEPYSMGENTLHSRYVNNDARGGNLVAWFRRLFGL